MKTELYGRRTYLWGLTLLWTTCPCRHHSHAALAMRTEANLPSFLLAYLYVGFLRVHLNPYLTLLVLALWTVAVTAAVVADMCLTALKQVGGIRMTQGVSGKRRIQLCLYKTFLQTCTDEGWCDESILAELLEDAIAEGWYPLNCYVGDFLRHM